jgi:hypothetical protein
MSFPKMGKNMPTSRGAHKRRELPPEGAFADMVAIALRASLGGTHAAIKTTAGWTGANERTVKNWLAGRCGPCGDHFVGLVTHSDVVLDGFLELAGRRRSLAEMKILEAIEAMRGTLVTLERLMEGIGDSVDRGTR